MSGEIKFMAGSLGSRRRQTFISPWHFEKSLSARNKRSQLSRAGLKGRAIRASAGINIRADRKLGSPRERGNFCIGREPRMVHPATRAAVDARARAKREATIAEFVR